MKVFLIGTNQDKVSMATDMTRFNIDYDHNSRKNVGTALQCVSGCDLVIMSITNGGYAYINETVELGIALGIGKKVWLVCGEKIPYTKTNYYLNSYGIKRFNSWGSCLKALYDLTATNMTHFSEEERSPPFISNFS